MLKKFFNKKRPLVWFDTDKYNWNVKCPKCKSVIDLTEYVKWDAITHPPTGFSIACVCGRHLNMTNGIVIPNNFIEDGEKFKCAECGGYGRIQDTRNLAFGCLCEKCNGEGVVDWIHNIRGK